MRAVIVCLVGALLWAAAPAHAEAPRRVALVIGNEAYRSLAPLGNPRMDAGKLATLLDGNGFDVVRCDGQHPGCFDLDRDGLEAALEAVRKKAEGADLALVFYAGHGMEGRDGNVIAPVDMEVVDCVERALRRGVPLDALLKAVAGARSKIVILDACRNDPFAQCPPERGVRRASFGELTVPDTESYLLVSSTKPGQEALDGPTGGHSPYAQALLAWLQKTPELYFPQVLSYVAKEVIEDTAHADRSATQVPEMLQRGKAPDTCLKGEGCVGDVRFAALTEELEALRKEHVRDQEAKAIADEYLAAAEKARAGRPLTEEEKKEQLESLKEVSKGVGEFLLEAAKGRGRPFSREDEAQERARLMEAIRALPALSDTRADRALERLKAGDESEAERLFAEEAAARERAAQMAQDRAQEENRKAAQSLRHLAAITRPKNVAKAADTYKKATDLDPADAQTWIDYARTAIAAGRRGEARAAYGQAEVKARESNNLLVRYRSALGLGDAIYSQEDRAAEERYYRAALALAQEGAKANPGNPDWQRALSAAYCRIGDILFPLGPKALPAALENYQACHALAESLAKNDPGNGDLQQDLAWTYAYIGRVRREQGDLVGALASYQAALEIAERHRDDGGTWWGQIGIIHSEVSSAHQRRGDLAAALASMQTALDFVGRMAKSDPSNASWQRVLGLVHFRMGFLQEERGDRPGALATYQAARAVQEQLITIDPGHPIYLDALADTRAKMGAVLFQQGDHAGALASYQEALAIRQRLMASGFTDSNWQADIALVQRSIGDVLKARGDLSAALTNYRDAVASYGKADPDKGVWQWGLAIAHREVGEILEMQGDLAGALASNFASRSVDEHMIELEPGNAYYQRDLSISHRGIGNLLKLQGRLADAVVSYRAALAIDEAQLKAKPDTIATLESLRSSHYSIGLILRQQGDLAGALASFEAGLAANERLATIDSGNSDRQRAIWGSHATIGEVLQDQGRLADALAHYAAAQDIAEKGSKASPASPEWQRYLAGSYRSVGGVRYAKGDKAGALALWHQALAIVEVTAVSVEQEETKSAGKPGPKTADALREVGWNALIARDVAKAAAAWERWSTLASDRWPEVGRAHILLFRNRPREARALYLKGKGTLVDNRAWEQVIANDFGGLRRAGLARPMMHEIEVALGVAPVQASRPGAASGRRAAKP